MTTYASGSVRVPGLSGNETDFVGMIKKLRDIESRQVTQLGRWKKDWQTRLNAFKELRGELMNMQSSLNSLNSLNKFLAKSTVSSKDTIVTAVADADSVNSNYKINVNQTAENCTWTKDIPLYDKKDVITTDTGLFEYSYKGKTRSVNVPKGTTVEGLIKLINNDSKNPGVRAQIIQGADGLTFQLRGMDTGKSNAVVIRKTENLKGLDVTLEDPKYTEESHRFTLNTDRVSNVADFGSKLANDTSETKTFVYTVDGTRRVLEVPAGHTYEQLRDDINAQMGYELATFTQVQDPDDLNYYYHFSIGKENTTHDFVPPTGDATVYNSIMNREWGGDGDKILPANSASVTMSFQVATTDVTGTKLKDLDIEVEIDDEMTLRDLMNAIKGKLGSNATVSLVPSTGDPSKFTLDVSIKDTEHRVTVEDGTLESTSYVPPEDPAWDVKAAKNAQVRINGYPKEADKWLEVASNTLKSGEVMPGITFYLHSTGEAEVSVTTDKAKIKENIETFVESVNAFRTKLMELTEYDETKEVFDPEYAESQFEMQKGGILQGNYGVQMVASRLKNAVAGNALGFSKRILDTDGSVLSGDIFTTFSQIGITTNATRGEANYGLLEINYIAGKGGSKSLDQALDDDPEAVAKLFAVDNEGHSSSDKFHYDSHLASITKPGSYNVSYQILPDGTIDETTAYINGQLATVNQETKTLTAKGDNNAAKGLIIQVADSTPGLVVKDEIVSIKSGKIQEILGLLEGSEGILGTNGTLRNLERNYQGIIDGIDDKIKKEDDRIKRWENTMVHKFARLEAVLANYDGLQKTLESQLAQLNSGK